MRSKIKKKRERKIKSNFRLKKRKEKNQRGKKKQKKKEKTLRGNRKCFGETSREAQGLSEMKQISGVSSLLE